MVIFHSYISLPEGIVIQTNITNYGTAALYLFDRFETHKPAANSIQSFFFCGILKTKTTNHCFIYLVYFTKNTTSKCCLSLCRYVLVKQRKTLGKQTNRCGTPMVFPRKLIRSRCTGDAQRDSGAGGL